MNDCDAIVLHSGGMDSSICLAIAAKRFGPSRVVSLGFRYNQRHSSELDGAEKVANFLLVRRIVIDMPAIPGWETSSLIQKTTPIFMEKNLPNTFVVSRNGLFLMMASPLAKVLGARCLYIGVMEREGANSGYPDCSRHYIDLVQAVIQADLQTSNITIETPLVHLSKAQTLSYAANLGILDYLLEHTVSCYEGKPLLGCGKCPACLLRNDGIISFYSQRPQCIPPISYKKLFSLHSD